MFKFKIFDYLEEYIMNWVICTHRWFYIRKEWNSFQNAFSHIFAGGYSAGYYSYKWAEVLSADAYSLFEEEGIYNPETGKKFLKEILERGGEEEAAILFKNFRGREPKTEALLRHSGIQ